MCILFGITKMVMKDIFDAMILCKECQKEMRPITFESEGFVLRAVECPNCKERIVHPEDVNNFNHFKNIRGKTFVVKLRVVGNSHAISIPKEIVDFVNERHRAAKKHFDDMVRLCFEDFDSLSVRFGQ